MTLEVSLVITDDLRVILSLHSVVMLIDLVTIIDWTRSEGLPWKLVVARLIDKIGIFLTIFALLRVVITKRFDFTD